MKHTIRRSFYRLSEHEKAPNSLARNLAALARSGTALPTVPILASTWTGALDWHAWPVEQGGSQPVLARLIKHHAGGQADQGSQKGNWGQSSR